VLRTKRKGIIEERNTKLRK